MDGLVKVGKVDEAKAFFDMMAPKLRIDDDSYRFIMKAFFVIKKHDEVLEIIGKMLREEPLDFSNELQEFVRKETKGKKVVTSLDFQEEVSTGYAEGVNTGNIKVSTVSGHVSTVSGQVSTDSIKKSIPSPNKGQREGKARLRNKFYRRKLVSLKLSDWILWRKKKR
ncbi:pentatricopeptide repeat-containing protein, partial [Tanacetum coccineum]